MNFKNIFFLLLFFFNQAYSLEFEGDLDACTMLSNISSKYFDSKDTRISKNMPTANWELYGISFIEDIDHYRENY